MGVWNFRVDGSGTFDLNSVLLPASVAGAGDPKENKHTKQVVLRGLS